MYLPALALAGEGNASNVDLLVGDIYGGDYDEYGLPADVVAASLGKLARPKDRKNANPCDLARGILDAITNNVVRMSVCVCLCASLFSLLFVRIHSCLHNTHSALHTPGCVSRNITGSTGAVARANPRRVPCHVRRELSSEQLHFKWVAASIICSTERQRDKGTKRQTEPDVKITPLLTLAHTRTHTHTLSLSLSFTSSVQ